MIAGEDRIAIENAREEAIEAAFPSETHSRDERAKPAGTEPPLKRLKALAEKDGMERVLEVRNSNGRRSAARNAQQGFGDVRLLRFASTQTRRPRRPFSGPFCSPSNSQQDDGEDVDEANPAATETTGIAGPTPLADRDVKEEVADAAARVAAAARAAVEAASALAASAAAAAGEGRQRGEARGGEGGGGGGGGGGDKDGGANDDGTNNGGTSAVADEEAEEAKREAAVIDALADAEDDFERRGGGAEPAVAAAAAAKERSGPSSQPNHSQSSIIDEATREKVRAKLEAALEKADNAAAAAAAEKEGGGGGVGGGGGKERTEEDDSKARLRRSENAASVEAEAARGSTSRSVYFSKVGNAARLAASSALPLLPPSSSSGNG